MNIYNPIRKTLYSGIIVASLGLGYGCNDDISKPTNAIQENYLQQSSDHKIYVPPDSLESRASEDFFTWHDGLLLLGSFGISFVGGMFLLGRLQPYQKIMNEAWIAGGRRLEIREAQKLKNKRRR